MNFGVEALAHIRESSYVRRWHTTRVIGDQNLGHHQWNVAMIAMYLTSGECSRALLVRCLTHDCPEGYVGDMPGHAKIGEISKRLDELEKAWWEATLRNARLPDLNPFEWAVLKVADSVELMLYVNDQQRMGNTVPALNSARNVAARRVTEIASWPESEPMLKKLHELRQHYGFTYHFHKLFEGDRHGE